MRILQQIFQESIAKGSRSSVLQPFIILIGLLVVSICAVVTKWTDSPDWLLKSLVVALMVALIVFVSIFVYLLFTDRDALRSEKFTLSKMAMEKGLIGDSESGLFEIDNQIDEKRLSAKGKRGV